MANTGFAQGFAAVRARARQGQVGDFAKVSHLNAFLTGINSVPQSQQVSTSVMSDPGDDLTRGLTINGVSVTFSTGSGNDVDAIGAIAAAAFNADPLVRGSVTATYDAGTNTLTLTGNLPGDTFTVTINSDSGDTFAAISTTAANPAEQVPFGRAVIITGQSPGEVEDLVGVAKTPRFSAQVATIAGYVAAVPDTGTRIAIYEIRGSERFELANVAVGGTVLATDVTTLNTALPDNTVLVAADGADMTFTAEIIGSEFEVVVLGTSPVTVTATTGPNDSTSLHRALAGISLYSPNDEAATIGGNEGRYVPNRGIRYGVRGEIWVQNEGAVIPTSDPVYVELADGVNSGRFFNTSSATRVRLSRQVAQWRRTARRLTDATTVVHIDTGRAP